MFSKRWDYWLRTLQEGKVLEESIPRIKWLGHPEEETRKNLESCLSYDHRQNSRETFSQFVDWMLYGFGESAQDEFPKSVDDRTNAHWYKTFDMGLMMKNPYDYLGEAAVEFSGKGKWNSTGYFPTPMDISVLMVEMTMGGAIKDLKTASVCDPCVGSGRLLMAASNYSLNLYGMDIDYSILKVCKANMWMYVPWGITRRNIEGLDSPTPVERDSPYTEPISQVTPEVQAKLKARSKEGQTDLFGN